MRILALFVVLALAGCVADDQEVEPEPTMDEPIEPATAAYEVFQGEGTVQAAAGPGALGSGGVEFQVGDNATLVFAEIRWDDDVQDLNLGLASPSAGAPGGVQNYDYTTDGGSPGNPDNPHNLTVDGPEAGAWSGTAFANGGGAQVNYEIFVTVFYGETTVPEGYTALI